MVVEQRIGRLDRIGQEADQILIFNLIAEDTIDERIYERLYKRLNLFRRALGDLEPVLGPIISELTRDLLTHRLTEQQQEERVKAAEHAIAYGFKRNSKRRLLSLPLTVITFCGRLKRVINYNAGLKPRKSNATFWTSFLNAFRPLDCCVQMRENTASTSVWIRMRSAISTVSCKSTNWSGKHDLTPLKIAGFVSTTARS